jgi:hypothetical protein
MKITDAASSVSEFAYTIFVEPEEEAIIEESVEDPIAGLEIPDEKSFAEFY